jgi:HEAT repeat protein
MSRTTDRRLTYLISIALLIVPTLLCAQEGEERLSVEELYLESEISVEILARQMRSPERNIQLLALDSLESQLERGLIDPRDEAILEAVTPLVEHGVITAFRENRWSIESYDPMVRREAVRVLGKLEGEAVRNKLVQTVRQDPEPIVQAQALFGLARMGSDPSGEVTRTIAKMMLREHLGEFDEGVVYAALVALRSIASEGQNVMDPASVEMLVYVASDVRYSRLLRTHALETLSLL